MIDSRESTKVCRRRGKRKLSGKRIEFGRNSGEHLCTEEVNLSGKRTEADRVLYISTLICLFYMQK